MPPALPPLSALRAFEAFARLGGMTAAGAELGVTHGAVSRQVRALEARLGVRLVEGPRHALTLTDAGRKLAEAASAGFARIASGLPGAGDPRELTLSCLGTLAMKWLIPRLPDFLARHPGVKVRIVESHAPADFSTGGIQAAIRILEGRPPEGMSALAFMAHFHGPVAAPELWASCGRTLPGLMGLPRLHSETFRPAWAAWARRAGVDLPPAPQDREFEHNSYMLEAAAAGLGAAIAPWAFAEPDVTRGRLMAPFGFEPVEGRYVLLSPARSDNPAVEALGAWLKVQGAASPPPPPAVRP